MPTPFGMLYDIVRERHREIQASAGRRLPREIEQPARTRGSLRCLWYDDRLADTLASVDEFLQTPAAIAALAEFCRSRLDSRAPVAQVRDLVDAVGAIADSVRTG